ncbi:ExbD/TolR family protein [Sandaracinus amylolyticus]|uniref:Biopolymer transport protein ExbD/TolR n=1 Tax=Sandaracinus amylolyticus TaxID=927083 RepID=A0A0F6W868_9BACT|nr:biopolymer transporter ExbD [Sandaracinus amylolyticus]AKF09873.1 Biopolymer transport protein ExbD/TolR [Sandaracinus amylolyticus]
MGMSMQSGGGRRGEPTPDINITPLVDVVLVLLIIFMVIAPMLTPDLDVTLPSEPTDHGPPPDANPIVVEVTESGALEIDGQPVAREAATSTLRGLLGAAREKTVFVRVHDDAMFRDAIAAMDIARGAGAEQVGTVLDRPAAVAGDTH